MYTQARARAHTLKEQHSVLHQCEFIKSRHQCYKVGTITSPSLQIGYKWLSNLPKDTQLVSIKRKFKKHFLKKNNNKKTKNKIMGIRTQIHGLN